MRTAAPDPCRQTYALRLHGKPSEPHAVQGQIEHVLSGDRLDFDSPSGLLSAIAELQQRALRPAQALPGTAAPPSS